jgi:hypothetical protein
MLCALAVRRLKPGSYDDFVEAFRPSGDGPPSGWKGFRLVRDTRDEHCVVTFGFFDGTLEELESSQDDHGYAERRAAADQFVEETVVNSVFSVEIAMDA